MLGMAMKIIEVPFAAMYRLCGMQGVAWAFLTPNLILFGLFVYVPIALNIYYSVTGGTEIFLGDRSFVGGSNYRELFNCERFSDFNSCSQDVFWKSVRNTALFTLFQVGVMVMMATVTALVLNREIMGRGFFRSVFFFPVLLSAVVVALIWKWILQRNGVANAGLESFGFEAIGWMLDRQWAFFWSIFLSIWAHMGFYTLILLAGLQAIPGDVYDAAKIDAANPWRVFRKITLPLLAPTMLVVVLLATIRGVQTFDEVYAFTGGGPGTATTLIIQYIYNTGFAGNPQVFGLAAAASVLLAIVLIVLVLVQLKVNGASNNG